jgi:hypothetical protein
VLLRTRIIKARALAPRQRWAPLSAEAPLFSTGAGGRERFVLKGTLRSACAGATSAARVTRRLADEIAVFHARSWQVQRDAEDRVRVVCSEASIDACLPVALERQKRFTAETSHDVSCSNE